MRRRVAGVAERGLTPSASVGKIVKNDKEGRTVKKHNTNFEAAAGLTRKLLSAAICTTLVAMTNVAQAQGTDGILRGTVQGAGSATVVEVIDDSRGTTRTEAVGADGAFDVRGLRPGTYRVRVIQNGNAVDSLEVDVSIGSATTVSLATSAAVVNEIVATGRRLTALDTSIAESGLVISSEVLLELPIRRDLTSVALLAPGANAGDSRFGNLASFGGSSVAENTSFINGLNTTNFRTGVGFSQVPFEFYDTIQVKTGGYSAKFGRSTGGVMNATTKSGSNEWDFGINAYYNDQLETSPDTFASANELDENSSNTYDVYASGPIIKDRLFFYALYSDDNVEQRYAGLQSERDYDYNVNEGFYGVKLDGYITPEHHLEYTYFTDERTGVESVYAFDADSRQRGAYVGDTLYERGGENWIATYTGNFGPDLELSLSYGENSAARTTAPASASIPVVYEYSNGAFQAIGDWSNFTVSKGEDRREMTRANLNWTGFANHDISIGIDYEDNFADEATINSGGVYWLRDPDNTYNECNVVTECPQGANARRRTYSVGGSFATYSEAYYIQDVWTVSDKLTFELGFRNESFENQNASGGVFVAVENEWAPRFAAVFDPIGNGRQKFFLNWGQYHLPIAANTNIRMAGNETYIHDYFDWNGVSVDAQGVPTNLGPAYDQIVFGDGTVPDTRSTTDANLQAMFQEETIIGYQWTTDSGIELGIKGIDRRLGATIEDVAIDAAVIKYYNTTGNWTYGDPVEDVFGGFHQYVLTNPGADMRVYIPENDEFIDLSAELLRYPEASRRYRAVELTMSKPFADNWSADLSYTYSRSKGNHEGYVKSDNGQDDAGITQNFDQPGLVDNSFGRLPNDRTHTVKGWGSYEFNNGLRIGANLIWQSGRPISCFGVHPQDVFAGDYGASSHFCQGSAVTRGSLGETDNITNIDLSAQYELEFFNSSVLLTLDVFNAFNFDNVLRVSEEGDTFSGAAEPDFLKPVEYQRPRALRLSARYNF